MGLTQAHRASGATGKPQNTQGVLVLAAGEAANPGGYTGALQEATQGSGEDSGLWLRLQSGDATTKGGLTNGSKHFRKHLLKTLKPKSWNSYLWKARASGFWILPTPHSQIPRLKLNHK